MKIILLSINLFIVSLFGQTGTIRKLSSTGSCLDVNYNSGDNVYLHPCHGGSNQRFELGTADSEGFYEIRSIYNNECIDANFNDNDAFSGNKNDGIVNSGDNIYTHPCHGGDNQKWKIDGLIIRSKANGGEQCLDVGDSSNNAHIWSCNTANDNQKLLFITDEIITISSRYYDFECLDVNFNSGDNVYRHPCHGGSNQEWRRSLADTDGNYVLISEYNGECLDANPEGNGVVDTSDNIYTWPCHAGINQKWRIDTILIRSAAQGNYCIDAGDSNDNVHIWTCDNTNNNQRFSTSIVSR